MEIACITLIVYMCVYRIVNVLIKPFNQCNLACNMFLVHTQCYLVICEHDETFKTPTYCYDLYYYDKIFTYITLGECNKVFFIICWGEIHKNRSLYFMALQRTLSSKILGLIRDSACLNILYISNLFKKHNYFLTITVFRQ